MTEKVRGKELIGKTVVSEEGRKFGIIGDVSFIAESGELMNIIVVEPTKHARDVELTEDDKGRVLIPFSAVKGIGEFVIINEKDIV